MGFTFHLLDESFPIGVLDALLFIHAIYAVLGLLVEFFTQSVEFVEFLGTFELCRDLMSRVEPQFHKAGAFLGLVDEIW